MSAPLWLFNLWAFIKSPTGLRLTLVLLAVALIAGAYLKGRGDQREADQAAARTALAKAEVRDAHADATADVQRVKDQAAVSTHQEALQHADDASPDSRPSAARLALACARLRQQNPRAAVPAGCGPHA